MEEKEALLVVDIDNENGWPFDTIEEYNKYERRKAVAQNIVQKLEEWRKKHNALIVFIIYPLRALARNTQLKMAEYQDCIGCDYSSRLPRFLGHRHHQNFEPIFIKSGVDAFSHPRLVEFLNSVGVKKVAIIGCQTFECIQATALGAAAKGFRARLLADCVFPPFEEQKIKDMWMRDVRANLKARSQDPNSVEISNKASA